MTEQEPSDLMDDEFDPPPPESWRDIAMAWGPAILAVIFIRLFIFEPFRIPSGSMVPTLLIGDHVMVTKYSYGIWMPWKSIGIPFTNTMLTFENVELVDLGDPERGDIVVFHYPREEAKTYIKRVVGLPGDRIRVANNQIFLNGERMTLDPISTYEDETPTCGRRPSRSWVETLQRRDAPPLTHGVLTSRGGSGRLANRPEIVVPEDAVFVMGDNRDASEDSRAWGIVRYNQIKGKAHFIWLSWDGCASAALGNIRLDRMPRSLYEEDDLNEVLSSREAAY